jgi:excisionase family DNA binding protein
MTRMHALKTQSNSVQAGTTIASPWKIVDEPRALMAAATPLLRIGEAAAWLGLSKRKTYELLSRGEIESVYIGRSRRITVAALQHFVSGLSHDRN